jgi:hypothetical protein
LRLGLFSFTLFQNWKKLFYYVQVVLRNSNKETEAPAKYGASGDMNSQI